MDREAWRAAVHGVAKNRTRLSHWTELNWEWLQELFEHKVSVCTMSTFWVVGTKQISGSTNQQGLVEQTPHWKPLRPGNLLPIWTSCTGPRQFGQDRTQMPDQCLAKVLPRVFPRLHRIPVILGKWQRVPAVPLATAPYSRHVLDGSLHPDLLLCSLSIWLHFLALISMILIIWQFSLWQFLSLTSFSL